MEYMAMSRTYSTRSTELVDNIILGIAFAGVWVILIVAIIYRKKQHPKDSE